MMEMLLFLFFLSLTAVARSVVKSAAEVNPFCKTALRPVFGCLECRMKSGSVRWFVGAAITAKNLTKAYTNW